MILINLQEWQKLQAVLAGTERKEIYNKNKWHNTQHIRKTQAISEQDDLQRHILAVGAEIAVHEYFGLVFEHKPYPVADVGLNVEVRHSPTSKNLTIRTKDKNEHWAVLVYGDLDGYQIQGYINIGQGKRRHEARQGSAPWDIYWMIPGSDLRPIDELSMIDGLAHAG